MALELFIIYPHFRTAFHSQEELIWEGFFYPSLEGVVSQMYT